MPVSVHDFEQAIRVIQRLVQVGAMRVLVSSSWNSPQVQFEVVDDHPAVQELRLDEGTREVLADRFKDVAGALAAAMENQTPETFAARRASAATSQNEPPDESAETKLRLVEQAFSGTLPTLRARFWIKRTSHVDTPGELRWETLTKLADSEPSQSKVPSLPYAVLTIAAGQSEPFLLTGRAQPRVTMTVDLEDVTYMIDRLSRLQRRLNSPGDGT